MDSSESPVALKPGLEAECERVIPTEWTLVAYDPRLPNVLSTPAMIGMMEVAAAKAIQPALLPGTISVGTRIEVDHLKAVPIGTLVRATARYAAKQGKFLQFDVEARAGDLIIGRGRVYRAIIELARFAPGANSTK